MIVHFFDTDRMQTHCFCSRFCRSLRQRFLIGKLSFSAFSIALQTVQQKTLQPATSCLPILLLTNEPARLVGIQHSDREWGERKREGRLSHSDHVLNWEKIKLQEV